MSFANDRGEMVLAMRDEADVAEQDHLVVAVGLVERGAQDFGWIVAVAGEPFLIGAAYSIRRAQQAGAGRVLADPAQERADRRLGLLLRALWPELGRDDRSRLVAPLSN